LPEVFKQALWTGRLMTWKESPVNPFGISQRFSNEVLNIGNNNNPNYHFIGRGGKKSGV